MSKEVKRYFVDCNWLRGVNEPLDDCDVRVVLASDYEALLAERDRLREALESCMDALWEDSREVRMDDTMMFGHGYDWDGWEIFRWELHTRAGSFAIWPAHGTYSAYGGNDGTYWNQCFADAKEAKAAVVKHVARVDPEHPAAKAYALLEEYRAALQGEQP